MMENQDTCTIRDMVGEQQTAVIPVTNTVTIKYLPSGGYEIIMPAGGLPVTNNSNASPVFLSKKIGMKIDLIRILNAVYENGMVTDANGGKLTKQEYFSSMGKAFNIDLTNYYSDLSNSMSSSVAYEKQTRIFDELKRIHQDIYNSK